ncbi:MAG: branched-chain amino acid transaminase [Parcubacteria group bacterium]|nr:branched-chain amino acid transaminase [Parcubacteria group bacterium]
MSLITATKYIWLDGKFVPWREAKIHVVSHALHYGSSVFEGIRLYATQKGPAVFRLADHLERFFISARALGMKIPFIRSALKAAVLELIKKNKLSEGYIRPLAFFGYGVMTLRLTDAPVNVAIATWPWGKYLGEKALRLKTSSFIRIHPQSTIADAKIGGHYVNSILAGEEAHAAGFDEALLLDFKGRVAEGPGQNIFMVKKGILVTPPLEGQILPGITRASLLTIARDQGLKIAERHITPGELRRADEVFICGTATEVTEVTAIDRTVIGKRIGPITKQLKEAYRRVVRGLEPRYRKWLTYV